MKEETRYVAYDGAAFVYKEDAEYQESTADYVQDVIALPIL